MPIYKPCGPSDEDRSGKNEYKEFVEEKNHKGVIIAVMVIDATCEDGGGRSCDSGNNGFAGNRRGVNVKQK